MSRTAFIGTDLYYSQEFVDDKNKELLEYIELANKLEQEIETLKENVNYYKSSRDEFISSNTKLREEKIRLHSIIKEVREYIEEKYDYILKDDTFLDHDERIDKKQIQHILEILDKINNDR